MVTIIKVTSSTTITIVPKTTTTTAGLTTNNPNTTAVINVAVGEHIMVLPYREPDSAD